MRRACFMLEQKKIVFPGKTPSPSLMLSSINSRTIKAFVPLLVTDFSMSLPSKLISATSLPSRINFFWSSNEMVLLLIPCSKNLVFIFIT
ncbi:hypothetical protein D9M68_281080 [compost metagenome]